MTYPNGPTVASLHCNVGVKKPQPHSGPGRPVRHGIATALVLLTAILAGPVTLSAAVIMVTGRITVAADYGTEFITGDTFGYSFSFDDLTTDTRSETYSAQFQSGVSAFSLTRGGANSGSWDPSSATFIVSPAFNFNANANSDSFTLQMKGTGLPQIGGKEFLDLSVSFDWTPEVRNFVDTGSGQTFAELVGTSGLDFSTANSFFAEFRNTDYAGPSLTMQTVVVPEPAAFAAIAGAFSLALVVTRRRHAGGKRRGKN